MPIYRIACAKCGAEQDVYRAFKDYDDLPDCCGEKTHRMVTAPYVMGDIQPYRSMATGEMINSRSEHKSMLKAHRLVEVGDQTHYLKPKPISPPPGLKETLIRVANEKLRST
jgi:putative FmdB family regulatory protein